MNSLFLLGQAAAEESASLGDPWRQVMFGLDSDERFVILLVAIGCATAVVLGMGIIFGTVSSTIHRRSKEIELKTEMLDRGMSADEIAQVVEATPPTDFLERWASRRKG